jgi:hypothetical protein
VVGSHRLLWRFKIFASFVLTANLLLLVFFRVRSGRIQVSALFLVVPVFNLSFIFVTGQLTGGGGSGGLLLLPVPHLLHRTLWVGRESGLRFCF